ncbi:hypothetical protein J9874_01353 [Duffyella gerundensis]|jgi:uncharacterized membrane protein YobD (UPF0266 family)|uniref:UPF0266 membrane protein EM595_2052 n=1 Tax=Duffyella gerundensis TaxID=1619313 RepID=A0A0U5L1I6_9GAMM|nr:DUF986 family protein [Duffyella gerundensis]QTO55600.1 DUF986 domain-containing protein [Duffyella gerundensis]UCB30823.1 hypothetical protein J9874_01353 [Duffyella gerundensis]CUU24286.1 putative membrane protein [Duffyella gerundensis]
MTLTDSLILALIVLLLGYAIYDELIMPRRYGPTRLRVPLRRRARLDSLIFIGLLVILVWNNISRQGQPLTTTLLLTLIFMAVYLFWIRRPKLLLKEDGFFFSNIWIRWPRVQAMNLSEDGVLVMQLEQKQLLIHVCELDDLEKIYHTIVKN